MSSIKLGVLSDTHRKVDLQKDALKILKEKKAEYLLHLGDIRLEENLKSLKESGLPYVGVFGNHDSSLVPLATQYNIKKEPYYVKIKDTTIKMMHLPYYLTPDSDIVLFGHLHKFSVEFHNNTLFLNPGEICARNKNLTECALIEVTPEYFMVEYLFKEPQERLWQSKQFKFKRG